MDLEELQNELRGLISQTVTFKRIAGNSIIIYFFGEPGDETVASIFIDPSWRYERNGKVILGSYDLLLEEGDFGSEEEYEQKFNELCDFTDDLMGAKLIDCSVDLKSSDIRLEFDGDQILRNFANSAFEDKHWTYRNIPKGICAYASPLGVKRRDEYL